MITASVRTFAPERWGEVDVFRHFHAGTHTFKNDTTKAISGVANHFGKALTLYQLSLKLLPNLSLDEDELQSKGYSSTANAKEFSAVLEEVFTELYSSIDCTRKIIVSIYKKTRWLPNSTRKLFRNARNDVIGDDFPIRLKQAIAQSDWYEELLSIRDELTHSDIGNCWPDKETGTVRYFHHGIHRSGNPLIIDDVMGRILFFIESVNAFLGTVFNFLNTQLKFTTIDQMCGIFFGRLYLRKLPFTTPIDINSGTCVSHKWFDNLDGFTCPLAESCGAYRRAKSFEP